MHQDRGPLLVGPGHHVQQPIRAVLLGEHPRFDGRRQSSLSRHDPHLDEPHRIGVGGVLLRVPGAGAKRHPLGGTSGQHDQFVVTPQVVGVLEQTLDHIGDALHVPVRMHRPGHAGDEPVVVEHAKRPELHPFGVEIVIERKVPPSVEPPALFLVDLLVAPNLDHPSVTSCAPSAIRSARADRRMRSIIDLRSSSTARRVAWAIGRFPYRTSSYVRVRDSNRRPHAGKARATSLRYSAGVAPGGFGIPRRFNSNSASAYQRRRDEVAIRHVVDGQHWNPEVPCIRGDARVECTIVGRSKHECRIAQVARVDRAALAHPLRRGALVAHAHLIGRIREQPSHDRAADRSGAAGDEHAAHPLATSAVISEL